MSSPTSETRFGPPVGRPRAVATVGKFDGVHLGHRHLVRQLCEAATARGAESVAVVLHPDPATVLTGRNVPLLTTLEERCRRLAGLGLDHVWHVEFDRALVELTPAGFLDLLGSRIQLEALVAGPDFAIGKDRAGTLPVLAELGRARGFELVMVPPWIVSAQRVGSRRIRELILAGDVEGAAELLGAPPWLEGLVVAGARRGRTLGFPTANLALVADFAIPANGIYVVEAAWTWPGDGLPPGSAYGLASVGVRPTFDSGERIVEVYLLDFDGDLYGARMEVGFLSRLRGEECFPSAEALVTQMHRDEAEARARLG